MNLPPLTLPKVPIPFEIADMLHPMVVHFAIALPVVVLLLEIINLFVKKRAIGVVSFLLLLIGSATVAMSYLTGNVDATLSNMAEVLKEHQTLGAYLVVLSAVVLALKLMSVILRTGVLKALYMMLLIVLSAGVCKSAFDGFHLVYHNGINVKKVQVLQKKFDIKNTQAQKLNSAYKILVKEKESLKTEIQEVKKQNEVMKQEIVKLQEESKAKAVVDSDTQSIEPKTVIEANTTSIIDDINQSNMVQDTNITEK